MQKYILLTLFFGKTYLETHFWDTLDVMSKLDRFKWTLTDRNIGTVISRLSSYLKTKNPGSTL